MRLLLLTLLLASPAHAQTIKTYFSSGTGFFVSRDGDIVTNAHVIAQCRSDQVQIRGALETTGRIIARDTKHDIAIIRSDKSPGSSATLSESNSTLHKGAPVMVMGYPGNAARTGEYEVASSEIVSLQGPTGESHWLQFTHAAQQGNSGGPLLNESGHVSGVVTGRADMFEVDELQRTRRQVSSADIAVSLPVLKSFLDKNRVRYRTNPSVTRFTPKHVERMARRFIVNIRCITSEQKVSP